jgi:hypothetical protein
MSIRSLPSLALAIALLGLGCASPNTPPTPPTQPTPSPGNGQFCGGIAAMRCPNELSCEDDPRDDCDPGKGGADCGGICVTPGQNACDAFSRRYVSREPEMCARIRFTCEEGNAPFHDGCGCGCQPES